MKKLLKQYGFNSDMQYFEMILDSVLNGQRAQAKEQFTALPKINRKSFVKSVMGYWQTQLKKDDIAMFIDLI